MSLNPVTSDHDITSPTLPRGAVPDVSAFNRVSLVGELPDGEGSVRLGQIEVAKGVWLEDTWRAALAFGISEIQFEKLLTEMAVPILKWGKRRMFVMNGLGMALFLLGMPGGGGYLGPAAEVGHKTVAGQKRRGETIVNGLKKDWANDMRYVAGVGSVMDLFQRLASVPTNTPYLQAALEMEQAGDARSTLDPDQYTNRAAPRTRRSPFAKTHLTSVSTRPADGTHARPQRVGGRLPGELDEPTQFGGPDDGGGGPDDGRDDSGGEQPPFEPTGGDPSTGDETDSPLA